MGGQSNLSSDDLIKIKTFYSNPKIIEALLKQSKNKEIGFCFNMEYYGKRPDVLSNEDDVLTLTKSGVTSIHISEETWGNPMMLSHSITKKQMDELRIGWDLIIDIDVDDIEHSKACAHFLIKEFDEMGIDCFVKFSGGKGIHIAIPFEAFPKLFNGVEIRTLFPDAARIIIDYLRESIRDDFVKYFFKSFNIEEIEDHYRREFVLMGKKEDEFEKEFYLDGKLDPFKIVKVDTVAVSSRHLYRMVYSINEKSGLVSIPIKKQDILKFDIDSAKIDNVNPDLDFLNRDVKINSATKLLVQSYDFEIKKILLEEKRKMSIMNNQNREIPKIPEDFFPPCIKLILNNLTDGKKRSLFILQNFLSNVGWDGDDIELFVDEWNSKHEEPLRGSYIKGQLKQLLKNKESLLPPNCDNKAYYVDMGFCKPDNLCKSIKNPVTYTIRKGSSFIEDELKKKKRQNNKTKNNKKEEIKKELNN